MPDELPENRPLRDPQFQMLHRLKERRKRMQRDPELESMFTDDQDEDDNPEIPYNFVAET